MIHNIKRVLITRYSIRAQRLMLLAIWGGGVVLSILCHWQLAWFELDAIKQQNHHIETELSSLQDQVNKASVQYEQASPLQHQYDLFVSQLSATNHVATLLQAIEQLTRQFDLLVVRIEWLAVKPVGKVLERAVRLELQGDFPQLMAFMRHFQDQFPTLYSAQLIWQRADINQNLVTLKMTLNIMQVPKPLGPVQANHHE
jgi:Tfp pilus assembly protein PilO